MALAAEVFVKIEADAERFHRVVNRAEKQLDRLEKTSQRVSRGTVAALSAIAPAVVPIGSAAIGMAGALAASFGAAGAAVAGFGAVSVGVLGDVFEAAEDIERINEKIAKARAMNDLEKVNKLMKEQAAIMETLSEEQQRAAKSLADFQDFWDDFGKDFEKPVVDIFTNSLEVLQKTLKGLKPAISAAMTSIGQLMDGLSKSLDTKEFQSFFQFIAREAGPSIQAFGQISMNVFRGVMNLLMAFEPMTKRVRNGLVGVSQSFLEWTRSLKGSEGFKTFLAYVRENGPKVWNILKSLANIGKDVAVALAPLGSVILDGLEAAFQYVEKNMSELSQKIAEGVKKGDPQIIAQAFADLINRSLDDLQTYMGNIDWGKIGSTISNSIAAQAGQIAPHLSNALLAILNSMVSMIPSLMPSIILFAYEFAVAFVDSLFSWETWKPLVQEHGWSLLFNLLGLVFAPSKFVGMLAKVLEKIPFVGGILSWMATSLNKLGGPGRAKFKEKFTEIMQGAKEGFQKKWPEIESWIKKKLDELIDYLLSKIPPKVKAAAREWVNSIKSGIKNLPKSLLQWGKNAGKQFAAGLKSKAKSVASAARSLAAAAKKYLGFHSPTEAGPGRDSDKWAPNFVNMFAKGLEKGLPKIERAMNALATTSESAFRNPSTSGVSTTRTYNVTVNNYGRDLDSRGIMDALRQREWLDA
jgi:hypothetical protein